MITFLTSWLKKHHWIHTWGKWQEKEYSVTYFGQNTNSGRKLFQDRQCSVCGKKESDSL